VFLAPAWVATQVELEDMLALMVLGDDADSPVEDSPKPESRIHLFIPPFDCGKQGSSR
jgi:hypothetical protein